MLTIQQQNEILMAMPENIRLKYGIQPKDYSGYEKIEKNGFIHYPELGQIIVRNTIGVFWETKGNDVQALDINDPETARHLLEEADKALDSTVYVVIDPPKNEPTAASVRICFRDPEKIYRDGYQYEKISFDDSFICYRPEIYNPNNESDLAFLKGIYVTARYKTIQVFSWKGYDPDEWEVTWP